MAGVLSGAEFFAQATAMDGGSLEQRRERLPDAYARDLGEAV